MEDIIVIVGRILGVAFVVAISTIIPKISKWLETKIGSENMSYLDALISSFTKSAEQQFKADDPTGEIRNNYVKTELEKLGYVITNEIVAMIEAHVFELPHDKK